MTWMEYYIAWYEDFGRYKHIYKSIKEAWDQIETYMTASFPPIYNSLQGQHHNNVSTSVTVTN